MNTSMENISEINFYLFSFKSFVNIFQIYVNEQLHSLLIYHFKVYTQ